jgi:hypothetical protein
LIFLIDRYLRLELLEGVVAYHTGQNDKALNALKSAHAKFLQVSELYWYNLALSDTQLLQRYNLLLCVLM